ncbi:surface-adhesin E family protein [Novosphingobium sp.]|uniref:surface-adhesin E family protein n=1 Tax=Novosphingobium sp. TaxID=1874826 RepID=UPI0035B15CF9
MMRLISAAVIATMFTASAAQAEQWRAVSERTDEAPRVVMFVDQDSLTRSGNTAKANVMTVVEPSAVKSGGWNVSVIYREVDCSGKRTRQLTSKYYTYSKIIEDDKTPNDWADINEGSMVDGVAKVMCGTRDYHTGKVTDPSNFAFELFNLLPI